MTLTELARLANVSLSTASKAFSGAEDISEETREHIFRIARENGCFGRFYKGKYVKPIIAVISSEPIGGYYGRIVEALRKQIEQDGCICVTATDSFDAEKQEELLDYFISWMKVDGVIVFSLKSPLKKAYRTPVISLFSSADQNIDAVKTTMADTIFETAALLSDYGHRKVAFIGEKLTGGKQRSLEAAIHRLGGSCCSVVSDKRFEEAGEDGARRLLASGVPFTAVVCAYDNIAYGAIKEFKRHGLSIPDDVSVIGMDNLDTSAYTETSLTSIDFDSDGLCRESWALMKKKLRDPYYRAEDGVVVPSRLIIRESIRDLRK